MVTVMTMAALSTSSSLHLNSLYDCLYFLCLAIKLSKNVSESHLRLLHVLKGLITVLILK